MGGQRRLRETTKTQQTRIRTGTKALWQNEHTQPSICFLLSCFLSLWPANATSGDLPLSTPVFTPFVSYRGVCAVDARVRQAASSGAPLCGTLLDAHGMPEVLGQAVLALHSGHCVPWPLRRAAGKVPGDILQHRPGAAPARCVDTRLVHLTTLYIVSPYDGLKVQSPYTLSYD